jgi:adenylosuccinate lyase
MHASIPVTFHLLTLAADNRIIELKGDRRIWLETLVKTGYVTTQTPITASTQLTHASLTAEGKEFLLWLRE